MVEQALRLQGAVHPATLHELRALAADFSAQPDIARRQRLALAHMRAEAALLGSVTTEAQALHSQTLLMAHQALYAQLAPADRLSEQGTAIEPGALRTQDVAVGRHQPPAHSAVGAFLAHADARYSKPWGLDALLMVTACVHHRLAWVHPFLDGNGRACRLQTQLALNGLTAGLWSVNRGLARQRDAYYLHLSEAILPMQHVLALGPVTRGEFLQMTGLGERTGRKVLAQLLADGLLLSDSPKGAVRCGLPLDALSVLLPNLYPEAATTLLDE